MAIKRKVKRKVKDEPIILDAELIPRLLKIVNSAEWNYKTNIAQLQQRDKALIAFIILTGVRNSELQNIRKKQVRIYNTHILIANVQPVKHGRMREEILLPKSGFLAPFTAIVETWLKQLPDDENALVFPRACVTGALLWDKPLTRNRVFYIIHSTTGYFPHWFRGVCETIYGRVIFNNDAWALKEFMGIVNLDNTSPYVDSKWKAYTKNLFKQELKKNNGTP